MAVKTQKKAVKAARTVGPVIKVAEHPKVGIRPTIDGRRKGIRESLEEQTMQMARSAAELITSTLRHPDGAPVECVIADTTIGGVAEAAACADKFRRENVGVSLTVTPCWCYGIYGRDVQEKDVKEIPEDVKEKILRFVRAGLAVANMRGKSYLSMGSVAMGIAGSIVNPDFFEKYLGMRCESVDQCEIIRRVQENIYDPEEYKRAIDWIKKNCKENKDIYNGKAGKSRKEQNEIWEFLAKMTIIGRDLMVGNEKLAEMGFVEESCGHNAIAGGFQGQRQWTDFMPNGDFMETILNSSFDWNGIRKPFVLATENDACNGVAMHSLRLLRRPHLLEPGSDQEGDRQEGQRPRSDPPHQLRRDHDGRLRQAAQRRQARDEALLGNHREGGESLCGFRGMDACEPRLLPRRRILQPFPHGRRNAAHDDPPEHGRGTRSGSSDRGR